MNRQQKMIAKAFLEQIANGDLTNINPHVGLCCNLKDEIIRKTAQQSRGTRAYEFVESNCEDWEYFSGNIVYPVPNYHEDDDPTHKDFFVVHLWKGRQLEYRKSLAAHLLKKLEECDD